LEITEKLIKQNDDRKSHCQVPQKINSCNETMFSFPVTEIKIKEVKKCNGKHYTGTNEIPDI
jgi:hypothetical protein